MVFFLEPVQDSFHRHRVLKRHNLPGQSYQRFEAVNEMLPGETRRCSLECFYVVRVVFLEACVTYDAEK